MKKITRLLTMLLVFAMLMSAAAFSAAAADNELIIPDFEQEAEQPVPPEQPVPSEERPAEEHGLPEDPDHGETASEAPTDETDADIPELIIPNEEDEQILSEGEEEAELATVIFDANGGEYAPEPQTVAIGEYLNYPSWPVREGYSAWGWFTEPECINEFDLLEDVVTGDMTLYVKWVKEYMVHYETNGGEPIPDYGYVSNLQDPLPVPFYEGNLFIGWYMDPEFKVEAVPAAPLESDVTLYARWEPYASYVTATVSSPSRAYFLSGTEGYMEEFETYTFSVMVTSEGYKIGYILVDGNKVTNFDVKGSIYEYTFMNTDTNYDHEIKFVVCTENGTPVTGDSSAPGMWAAVLGVSAIALAAAATVLKKRREN